MEWETCVRGNAKHKLRKRKMLRFLCLLFVARNHFVCIVGSEVSQFAKRGEIMCSLAWKIAHGGGCFKLEDRKN